MTKNSANAHPKVPEAWLPLVRDIYVSLIDGFSKLPHTTVSTLGTISTEVFGDLPLVGVVSKPFTNRPARKKILITAGIHGDEPAGVYALFRFLEEQRELAAELEIHALPCVNPFGFVARRRSGSTRQDLNRVVEANSIAPEIRVVADWLSSVAARYDAVFDLHEDNPAVLCDFAPEDAGPSDYYLYETTRHKDFLLGDAIVSSVRSANFPVSTRNEIYREKAVDGVIRFTKLSHDRSDFNRYAFEHLSDIVVVSETPMSWPLERRIAAQVVALRAGCSAVLKTKTDVRS